MMCRKKYPSLPDLNKEFTQVLTTAHLDNVQLVLASRGSQIR